MSYPQPYPEPERLPTRYTVRKRNTGRWVIVNAVSGATVSAAQYATASAARAGLAGRARWLQEQAALAAKAQAGARADDD
jgi:hypothetical protein